MINRHNLIIAQDIFRRKNRSFKIVINFILLYVRNYDNLHQYNCIEKK